MKMQNSPLLTLNIIALSTLAGLLTGCAGPGLVAMGGPQTVWATPVDSGGQSGSCPGPYAGYVTYVNTNAWGWVPDTSNSNTVFTAADGGGRTDTCVVYTGKLLDRGCAQTMVTIPYPPHSTAYRFCIYFPNNVPTTNYPITLNGFVQSATNQ